MALKHPLGKCCKQPGGWKVFFRQLPQRVPLGPLSVPAPWMPPFLRGSGSEQRTCWQSGWGASRDGVAGVTQRWAGPGQLAGRGPAANCPRACGPCCCARGILLQQAEVEGNEKNGHFTGIVICIKKRHMSLSERLLFRLFLRVQRIYPGLHLTHQG